MYPRVRAALLVAAFGVLMVTTDRRAPADEGMWLFNNPPTKLLKEKYGFEKPPGWYEHIKKSCVRFPRGSGSFISPDGLVMTNHHVALDSIKKVSSKEHDYVKDGFYAKTRTDERKVDGLDLLCLQEIVDVTKEVQGAVDPKMSADEAFAARRAAIAKIEKDSLAKTKLFSSVATLFQGAQYHLYRYKRYTDVRLVFAPEQQIAFYGGDADNFAFPRYDLDVTFFRVYEDGKPAQVEHYLKWSKAGAKDNELVFVAGHPGRTDRLTTVAELEYLRDTGYPFLLQRLYRLEVLYTVYSGMGEEQERQAKDLLFGVANSRKAIEGEMAGLLDPGVMAAKKAYEQKVRKAIAANPELKDLAGAWDAIAAAQKARSANIRRHALLEQAAGFNSTLFGYARTLVRAADEFAKPNEKRLPEYGDAGKKALEQRLFADQPIHDELEIARLTNSLTYLAETLGAKDKLVQQVLAGKSPGVRAAQLVKGSTLGKAGERKKLYEGGKDALAKSQDALILLAKLVDKDARAVRTVMDAQVTEVKEQAYGKIAKAKFAVEGSDTYPDATFTLRLSYGTVKGYEEGGKKVPFETTFGGLYEYAREKKNKGVFELPRRWLDRQGKLNPKTPFNFVCTTDIIGGNSGSPVVNADGEVVGLIFDGNIQSLVWAFLFTDEQGRSVAVNSQALTESLRAVYDAGPLADEIVGAKK
jgi:hypothetical protein